MSPNDGVDGCAAVTLRVVAEKATDADPQRPVPREGALEKSCRRGPVIAREHFDVAQPRAVVDRDMDVLPAYAARATPTIAVNPVPDSEKSVELLRVEVHESARPRMLIAHDWARRLQPAQTIQAQPSLNRDDGREREAVVLRDAHGAPTPPPPSFDLPALVARPLAGTPVRARGAIPQPAFSLTLKPMAPLPDRRTRHSKLTRQLRLVGPRPLCAKSKLPSTGKRQSCILVGVHRSSGSCR